LIVFAKQQRIIIVQRALGIFSLLYVSRGSRLHRKQLSLLWSPTGASFLTLTRISRFDFLGWIQRALAALPWIPAQLHRYLRLDVTAIGGLESIRLLSHFTHHRHIPQAAHKDTLTH
jgi:hypothetical protein